MGRKTVSKGFEERVGTRRVILNNPLFTHLTLGDVRSAYESAARLAHAIEHEEPWEIGGWLGLAETVRDLLEGALVRHGVDVPNDDGVECAGCGELIVVEDEIESTPQGSMHAECAWKHEEENPQEW